MREHLWMPVLFAAAVIVIFLLMLSATDAFSTHADRMCLDLKRGIERQEQSMTVCYNDPECRLGEGDFAELTQMRAIKPRVCAGLPALPLQPIATPFPFTFPDPGTTARE